MKNPLLSARTFQLLLNTAGYFARRPRLNGVTRLMMRSMAGLTLLLKRGRRQELLAKIGKEWQRMFPSRKINPIREVTDTTVYAEVHARCPLANTGDVDACYRLMEYDRRMLKRIGGEFVVLESQADVETAVCQVAIRKKGANMDDLIPAHKKPLKSKRV